MANFHQLVLHICILFLCVVFSTVYGKTLKMSSTEVDVDGNKPSILFNAKQGKIGNTPVEDDEDYSDPAYEREVYFDTNYQQPLEVQNDGKQSQQMQSIHGTENKLHDSNNVRWDDKDSEPSHSLSENNEESSPVVGETKIDVENMMKEEYNSRQKMPDSVGQPRIEANIKGSDGNNNKNAPLGKVSTTPSSEKLNTSLLFKTVSDVMKRGAIKNATGNQNEKIFVNGSGNIEVPLMRGMSLPWEMSATKNDDRFGSVAVENGPIKTLPRSEIHKNETRIVQPGSSEPETGSAATQPIRAVTSSNDSIHDNKNGSDTDMDSIKPSESVTLSSNNDSSTSVKYRGNSSQVDTKLNSTQYSSSKMKPDGQNVLINGQSEATNPSKGGDGTQLLEQGLNNNTGSLATQKEGTLSQQGTSKAPSSATATSSKVPTKSPTSKPLPSQTLGDSTYDSSSAKTSTTTHVSTTDQKKISVKSDDSDLIIDQPLENNQGGGMNIQQPYQGELVEEGLPMVPSTPINDQDSHFFAYFASLLITAALGYVVYHNRNKILALLLEGRRARGSSGSRRGSSAGSIGRRRGRGGGGGAKYLPLHTSLDQVMTSNGTENGGESGLDRVY